MNESIQPNVYVCDCVQSVGTCYTCFTRSESVCLRCFDIIPFFVLLFSFSVPYFIVSIARQIRFLFYFLHSTNQTEDISQNDNYYCIVSSRNLPVLLTPLKYLEIDERLSLNFRLLLSHLNQQNILFSTCDNDLKKYPMKTTLF